MEPVKDIGKVEMMFAQGQTTYFDGQTGYKHEMVAICPKDGNFASAARTEKAREGLSKVTFRCGSCFNEFEVAKKDIYIL